MTHEENNMDPKSITNLSNEAVDGKNVMGGNFATGGDFEESTSGLNADAHETISDIQPLDNTLPGPLDEPGNVYNNPLDAHKGPGLI